MINFYNYKLSSNHSTEIANWSNVLNGLKKEKKYSEIESKIREYMSLYSFNLIKYSNTTHHDLILISNIKRWNKISEKFSFTNNVKYSKILLIFMINLEIKKVEENNSFFNDLNNIIENNSFDPIIIYGLNKEKHKILELLKSIPDYDLIKDIKRLYPDFIIRKDIKMLKLCGDFRNFRKKSNLM